MVGGLIDLSRCDCPRLLRDGEQIGLVRPRFEPAPCKSSHSKQTTWINALDHSAIASHRRRRRCPDSIVDNGVTSSLRWRRARLWRHLKTCLQNLYSTRSGTLSQWKRSRSSGVMWTNIMAPHSRREAAFNNPDLNVWLNGFYDALFCTILADGAEVLGSSSESPAGQRWPTLYK
jgi:hypothetical protein